jgi:hypothetical protein
MIKAQIIYKQNQALKTPTNTFKDYLIKNNISVKNENSRRSSGQPSFRFIFTRFAKQSSTVNIISQIHFSYKLLNSSTSGFLVKSFTV